MRHVPIPSRTSGFTLLELLVTVTVAAIVLTFGVPGFKDMMSQAKMTNAANSLIAHIQLARSEAIKRNIRVTLCPSANGSVCDSADPSLWHDGYVVGVIDDAGTLTAVLRRVDAQEMRGITASSGGRRRFVFQRDGSATGTDGTVKICDPRDPTRIRQVVVSPTGRAFVQCNDPGLYACPRSCP
jgi:type IV fimbrial biogenesis protein FimT